jgi:hypothetical protein
MPDHPSVEVKALTRDGVHYLLARSHDRKKKERAMRRRQRRALAQALRKLHARVAKGRLKNRDKIHEALGRLKARFPKAVPFVKVTRNDNPMSLRVEWLVTKFQDALRRDGAYLLRSNQDGWTAEQFWETYMQLAAVERACRVLKSELLLRPIWHHYSGRTQAHVFICVLAYALWKTLDHLAKRAGLQTLIRKPDLDRKHAAPKPRPMTPEVILRELSGIMIGAIELKATDGRRLLFRRVARPNVEHPSGVRAGNIATRASRSKTRRRRAISSGARRASRENIGRRKHRPSTENSTRRARSRRAVRFASRRVRVRSRARGSSEAREPKSRRRPRAPRGPIVNRGRATCRVHCHRHDRANPPCRRPARLNGAAPRKGGSGSGRTDRPIAGAGDDCARRVLPAPGRSPE